MRSLLPEIQVKIGTGLFDVTVDSASEATLISEEYFTLIKGSLNEELPTLPVTNITILGVTGNRAKKVMFQTQVDFNVDNQLIPITCLVVRGVKVDFLLGVDVLKEYKACLNFENNYMTLLKENKLIKINFKNTTVAADHDKIKIIQSNKITVHHNSNEFDHQLGSLVTHLTHTHTK